MIVTFNGLPQQLMRRRGLVFNHGVVRNWMSTLSSDKLIPEDASTIIQGPSLLTNTNKFRPSPSIFYLPGLRSLPFWTAPRNSVNSSKNNIAFGEQTISQIVNLLESNFDTIKEEYMHSVMGMGNKNDVCLEFEWLSALCLLSLRMELSRR